MFVFDSKEKYEAKIKITAPVHVRKMLPLLLKVSLGRHTCYGVWKKCGLSQIGDLGSSSFLH